MPAMPASVAAVAAPSAVEADWLTTASLGARLAEQMAMRRRTLRISGQAVRCTESVHQRRR